MLQINVAPNIGQKLSSNPKAYKFGYQGFKKTSRGERVSVVIRFHPTSLYL